MGIGIPGGTDQERHKLILSRHMERVFWKGIAKDRGVLGFYLKGHGSHTPGFALFFRHGAGSLFLICFR
jgi:hypothetical protein